MAATCGANFARIILVIFNIIFLIAGLCLICVGGWLLGDRHISTPFQTAGDIDGASFLRNAAILLIVIGIVVLFVTILGLYAAISENTLALGIYIALLVLVCIGEIAGGVVAIVFKDKMIVSLEDGMVKTLEGLQNQTSGKYYEDKCKSLNNAAPWDFFQYGGKCCGLKGNADYKSYGYQFNLQTECGIDGGDKNTIPWSCCNKVDGSSTVDPSIDTVNCTRGYYNEGCYEKLVYMVQRYAPVLIGIGLGFGFLELFGIIFAVCVCQNPSKDR